jgi:threonine synthase
MTQAIDRPQAAAPSTRANFTALRCKECGETYDLGPKHVCEDVCFGPLEVVYDYDAIQRQVTRASIAAGPKSIWRYKAFLPVETDTTD